ncbi:MAG: glycosyltransferase family 1 protein [Acidobacteriaceae bacterium]
MKILLISNYVPDGQQSMLRYPVMLQKALTAQGHKATIVHPPAVLGRLPFLRGGLAKWIWYLDKYLIAPWYLRGKVRGHDIVHICDHSNAMYVRCGGKRPQVITCHDLIAVLGARGHYPEVRTGVTGRMLQRWIAISLRRARFVICVSESTGADFRALVPDGRANVRVIPHALNRRCEAAEQNMIEQEAMKLGLAHDARYLLHVGGNQWYKNRLGTMQIFGELKKSTQFQDMHLVMAGKPWTPEMRRFAGSSGLTNSIIEATGIGDDALNVLYSGAQALLFPSLAEGFGWPVLEAQACGCPVITTERAPMTEVGGAAAIYIDPSDPTAAAKTILEQWPRRAALREAGLRNAATFTEEKMAMSYVLAYEEMLTGALEAWKGKGTE